MSVSEKNKVDGIAKTKDKKGIVMLITDHLPWDESDIHILILQDKIVAYVAFCEQRQYENIYRDYEVNHILFDLQFKHNPPKAATVFLSSVQQQLNVLGISLVYKTVE